MLNFSYLKIVLKQSLFRARCMTSNLILAWRHLLPPEKHYSLGPWFSVCLRFAGGLFQQLREEKHFRATQHPLALRLFPWHLWPGLEKATKPTNRHCAGFCLVFCFLFCIFKPGHLFWCLNGSRILLKIESHVSLSCISTRWWTASTALFYYKPSLIYSLAWLFSLYCFFSETAEAELLLSLSSSFSHTRLLISSFTICFAGLSIRVLWLKGRRRKGRSLLNRVKCCDILRLQISLCALNCACCSCCKCWRSDKVWPRCLHYPLALLVSGQSINHHTTYQCSVNWHRWSQGNMKCSVQTSLFCGWVVWFPVNNCKCVQSA